MNYLKKLANFFFIFLVLGAGGYFAAFNLDFIVVNIPHGAELRLRAAIVYIVIFMAGVTLAVLYFGVDAIRKSFAVSSKNKKIKRLEEKIRKLEEQSSLPPTSES